MWLLYLHIHEGGYGLIYVSIKSVCLKVGVAYTYLLYVIDDRYGFEVLICISMEFRILLPYQLNGHGLMKVGVAYVHVNNGGHG